MSNVAEMNFGGINDQTSWGNHLSEDECMTLLRHLVPIDTIEQEVDPTEDFEVIERTIRYIEELSGILQNTN